MKRRVVIKNLIKNGCALIREGGNHSWWLNPYKNLRSAVPRHSEIKDLLVKKYIKIWELINFKVVFH